MAVDVAALPLVLCGPMLRRVDSRSVSVFVALKAPAGVQLEVHDGTTPSAGDLPAHRISNPEPTVALGRHLHVAVVTLRIPPGSPALTAGQVYGYDVVLRDAPAPGDRTRLADTGLLAGSHPLGFVAGRLPGFTLMPDDLAALHLLHGSCRKPHGEGDDMLAALDDVLRRPAVHGVASARPQLLLLTGDQIYADDVAPGLLKALHDTGDALLDWEEVFAGTETDTSGVAPALAALRAEAEPLIDTSVAAGQAALGALRERLADAIEAHAFSENALVDLGIKLLLVHQLERFDERAGELAQDAGDALGDGLAALAARIVAWIDAHAEIFGPLSSRNGWGRIAGFETQTDPETATALEDAIRGVAEEGAAAAGERLGELAAAIDEHPDGRALADLVRDFRRRVDELAGGDAPATDAVVALAHAFLDELSETKVRDYVASRISPPQRAKELRQLAELTSDAMDAHLMFLGEFYAMYLFAFSPAAWPTATVAGEDGATSTVVRLPAPRDAVPNYSVTGALGVRALQESNEDAEAFAAGLPKVRRVLANVPTLMAFDDHEVTDDWNLHEDWVTRVNGSVMGARLLRNALGAFAVFQDWGTQPDDYLPGTAGRRVLDQLVPPSGAGGALGAPPAITSPGVMDQLLGVGDAVADELPGTTLDSAYGGLTVRRSDDGRYAFVGDGPTIARKHWDWAHAPYPDAAVRFVCLDTRTHRGFPTAQWRLTLDVDLDLDVSVGGKVAAPMLIHPAELVRQLDGRISQTAVNIVISPAPAFGLPLVEDLFQRLQALTSGPEVADFEAWQANPHGFDQLLAGLREADTVLLSGDVHYAYTNVIQFPEPNPNLQRNLLVQLTSSSLRNETGLTRLLGSVGREGTLLELLLLDELSLERLQHLGEMLLAAAEDVGETILEAADDLMDLPTWYAETAPLLAVWDPGSWITYWLALKDTMLLEVGLPTPEGAVAIGGGMVAYIAGTFLNPMTALGTERDGEVRRGDFGMRFLGDTRVTEARREGAARLNGITQAEVSATVERADLKLRQMPEIVGYNNVGRIDFATGAATPDDVRHELIWKVHGADGEPEDLYASTIHTDAASWPAFGERVAAEALREVERWHPPSGEIHEYDAEGLEIIRGYVAELAHLNELLPVERRFWPPVAADGSILSWSAVFISLCLQRAGAGPAFPYSSRHIDYVRRSKRHREEASPNPFYLYAKDEGEAVVQVGDIVVHVGGAGYDDIDVDATGFISSHCDIVVEVTDTEALCVGGNVEGDVPVRDGQPAASGWTCNFRAQARTLQDGKLVPGFLLGLIRRRDGAP